MTSIGNRIILVRHGASKWSYQGRYQGHQSVPLSHLGLEQVYALTEELNQYKPERIVSSDLLRAQQTAQVIAKHLTLKICYDVRLRELDCRNWAGLNEQEIEALEPEAVAELRAGHDIPRGGGETIADLMVRTSAALADWVKENFSGTLMFVSHAYVIRAMTQIILGGRLHSNHLPSLGSYTLLNRQKDGKWILERYGVVPDSNSTLTTVDWLPRL